MEERSHHPNQRKLYVEEGVQGAVDGVDAVIVADAALVVSAVLLEELAGGDLLLVEAVAVLFAKSLVSHRIVRRTTHRVCQNQGSAEDHRQS